MSEDDDIFSELIYARIWILRYTTVFICFVVTFFCAYKFVDYDKVNNRLLEDIRKQNADLKQEMKLFQLSSSHTRNDSTLSKFDLTDGMKNLDPYTGLEQIGIDTGELADDSDSDNDSTLSFDSTQTDRTWMNNTVNPEDEDEEFDSDNSLVSESFLTALPSENNSPNNPNGSEINPSIINVTSEPQSTPKRGRPKGSRSRSSTPKPVSGESLRYNLRNRNKTIMENPLLETETENDFSKAIQKMWNQTKRASAKINMARKANGATSMVYSSDEQ